MTADQVDQVYLAGGFANAVNVRNAIAIGLLAPVPVDRVRAGRERGADTAPPRCCCRAGAATPCRPWSAGSSTSSSRPSPTSSSCSSTAAGSSRSPPDPARPGDGDPPTVSDAASSFIVIGENIHTSRVVQARRHPDRRDRPAGLRSASRCRRGGPAARPVPDPGHPRVPLRPRQARHGRGPGGGRRRTRCGDRRRLRPLDRGDARSPAGRPTSISTSTRSRPTSTAGWPRWTGWSGPSGRRRPSRCRSTRPTPR